MSIGSLINGEDSNNLWKSSLSNEWGRLAQGNDTGVEATDTIDVVYFNEVSFNKKVPSAGFVCNHRPLHDEEWIIRFVVGGDRLTYEHD